MRARSAIFDIYGDHLLNTTGWSPVAALVQLTGVLDVAPAATRTAISRMVAEGWLTGESRAGVRGYGLTPRATQRLRSAGQRIYADAVPVWNRRWHLVVTDHSPERSVRNRLSASMSYLGYARLAADTWVAPRASDDLAETLSSIIGLGHRAFEARMEGDCREFAASLWEIRTLADAYRSYDAWLQDVVDGFPADADDALCYATRALVVHEWRKFLFTDPGLPLEALPDDWPGATAAARFRGVATRLRPRATAYVETCMNSASDR